MQELRVAQAGVQILFAFLLTVTFSARFGQATSLQRVTLLVTILLTTLSAVLLMAPAVELEFVRHDSGDGGRLRHRCRSGG